MLSISSLIDFLMDLLRDEQAQAEFARDPQAMLAKHGLEGVTAQDVCDVEPILADTYGVSPRHVAEAPHGSGGGRAEYHQPVHRQPEHHDPVREIHHVTKQYQVDREVVVEHHTPQHTYNEYKEYNTELNYYDHSVTTGDDSTVIQDSFNEDNDGVDNKGGVINDSNVANGDQTDVGNTDETTTIEDSFDEDNSEVAVIVDSGNDASNNSTNLENSLNDGSSSDSVTVSESANSVAVGEPFDSGPPPADPAPAPSAADSYAVDAPLADADALDTVLATAEPAV